MSRFSFALLALLTLWGGKARSQVNEDFESGSVTSWAQSPTGRWGASTDRPITGAYSLKHTYDNTQADVDYVGLSMNLSNIAEGKVKWRFLLKHGYAPSASNRWSVFLMASANAEQMKSGTLTTGYSIGINTTGSDDKLRIYKHSISASNTATTDILLETTFNWETEVGTTKAAAFEIERTASGTWTLRVAKDGLFANLQNLGTFQNSDFGTLQNLVVAYNYTSSADRNLWLDDISVVYTPLNSNNKTSTAEAPTTQISSQQIFTSDTTDAQAKELLRFKIIDKGDGDGLPTKPTLLKFQKSTSGLDLSKIVGKLFLKGESTTIPIKSATVAETGITMELEEGAISIADGAQQEFSLWATTQNRITIADHAALGIEIPIDNHSWMAAISGSGFASNFPATIGATHTIEVVASKIYISEQPLSVQKTNPFSITARATDHNGNIDLDFAAAATLSLQTGGGSLTIPQGATQTYANGVATWSNLTYSGSDNFSLKVTTSSLGEAISQPITPTNDSTTTITLATIQPTAKELVPGCETATCAAEIMRLTLSDTGGDGLPTIVTQIKLANAATSSAADWTKAIRFFSIKVNGRAVSLGNPTISKAGAIIPILPGDLTIPEGQSAEIAIMVGLNDKVTDGEVLQIKIESTNHGFASSPTGSAFVANLPQALTSNAFPINVVASRLIWKKMPSNAAVGEPFEVEADAVDQYGNIDVNYAAAAILSLTNAQGKSTTFNANISGGKAIFSGVSLSHSGEYQASATAGILSETPQATILIADKNSTLTSTTNAIPAASLPSSSNDYIPLLSINIKDFGTTDTLPTIITQATITAVPNDTATNFPPISAIEIHDNEGAKIPISNTIISNQKIEFTFANDFTAANNSSESITLYGKPSQQGVTDNSTFQFKIPVKDYGWAVSNNSTLLATTLPYEIISPQFTTQVTATIIQPRVKSIISANEMITITALATDSLGNLDLDYSQGINATITSFSTGTKSNLSSSFVNGKANFNTIGTLPVGQYRVELATPNLPTAYATFEVATTKGCTATENFESGMIPASWIEIDDWKVDQTSALGSPKSIRHNGSAEGKTSTLGIPAEANLRADICTLSISLKNGDWTPSSENKFCLLLASNSSTPNCDTISGYAVGVNQSGDDDTLKVWLLEKGNPVKTLVTTDFVWKENSQATIGFTLSPCGHRILSVNGKTFTFADTTLTRLRCMGIKFNYTATRAGLLWADDISLCKFATGPRFISAKRSGKTAATLRFSESIAPTPQLESKVQLWTNGNPIQTTAAILNSGSILLTAATALPRRVTLLWKELTDSEGNSSTDSANIDFGPLAEYGSIVINEIMADPTPMVGLPECEYVELYSRSSDTLNLAGWTISAGSSKATLKSTTLLPNGYLLLTSTTCANQPALAEHGAIGVTSFPSLTNAGTTIALKDQAGETIAQVNYADNWYCDAIKKEGGYSLEKIDAENLSEDSLNWKGSNDVSGGTPGRANSVKASNPDVTAPTLDGIAVISENTIVLQFSEPLLLSTISAERFVVESSLGGVAGITTNSPARQTLLTFANKMNVNTIYNLTISGITDLAGNSLATTSTPFAITELPKWQDIVINEQLFNPNAGGADFIEIYNRATQPFNLKHLKLYRRDDSGALTSEIRLSNYDRLIVPGEYVAFTPNPESIKQQYSCPNPGNLLERDIPAMNDDQGTVVLTDTLGERVDEVAYTDKMHYALLASTEGVSLERVNPDMPSDKASSWQSASQLSGFATPTAKNSCYREFEEANSRVTIDPELFSPDGDGYHDVTYIRMKLPEAGWNATITIYDNKGREVRKLLNHALVDVDGEVVWNGLTNDNRLAEMGIYVVLVEMFHLSGETRKEKKVVVVGGRL